MQKQFSRNILLLLIINLLIKPLYLFGIDAQVQNQVGHEAYGVYFALFNFCFLFQIFLDLGIQNYNLTYLSKQRDQVSNVFPYVLSTKLLLVVVFVALCYVFFCLVSYPSSYLPILFGLTGIMVLQSFYVFFRSHFSALGHYTKDAYFSGLDKLLMILILAYSLYIKGEIDIPSFIRGQLIALFISNIIVLIFISQRFKFSLSFQLQKSKGLLSKSFAFALVFLLMTLYTRMDGVMLERLLDDRGKAAGLYASGYRLLDAVNILGYLFASLLLPMFANLLSENKKTEGLVQTALMLLIPATSFISLIGFYYGAEILDLVYSEVELQNIYVFKYLMLSFWFISLAYIYGSLITASAKLRVFNMIFIAGIILNWGLNLYLIPKEMAVGAAKATLVTQIFVCLAQIILVQYRYRLHLAFSVLLKLAFIVGITFAFTYFLSHSIEMNWMLEIGLIGVLVILASFFSGILRLLKTEFS